MKGINEKSSNSINTVFKRVSNQKKYNVLAKRVFNDELGHSMDFSEDYSDNHDIFLVYREGKICAGFCINYSSNQNTMSFESLNIDLYNGIVHGKALEIRRVFVVPQQSAIERMKIFKLCLALLEFYILSYKVKYTIFYANAL